EDGAAVLGGKSRTVLLDGRVVQDHHRIIIRRGNAGAIVDDVGVIERDNDQRVLADGKDAGVRAAGDHAVADEPCDRPIGQGGADGDAATLVVLDAHTVKGKLGRPASGGDNNNSGLLIAG